MSTNLQLNRINENDSSASALLKTQVSGMNGNWEPPVTVGLAASGEFDENNPEKQRSDRSGKSSHSAAGLCVNQYLNIAISASQAYHRARKQGNLKEARRQARLKSEQIVLALDHDHRSRIQVRGSDARWLWSVRFRIKGTRRALHIPKNDLVQVIARNPSCLRRDCDRVEHWCALTDTLPEWPNHEHLACWLKLLGTLPVSRAIRNRARGLASRHLNGRRPSNWDLRQIKGKVRNAVLSTNRAS